MVAYVIDGTQESLVTLRGLPRSLRAELLPHRFTARTSRRKCSSSTVRSNAFLPGTSVNQDSSQVRIGSATLPNCPLFNAQQGSRTEPCHLGSGALLTHLACDLIRAMHGLSDSNTHRWFWRPKCYHYTKPTLFIGL